MSRFLGRRSASLLAAAAVGAATLLAAASPSAAAPGHRAQAGWRPVPAGANLLANAGAETGAASKQGWDEVTIPGWQVSRGLPTVVGYGTAGFPGRADAGTAGRARKLFAGGAGGTAALTQQLPLRTPAGQPLPAGTRFSLAAWLGGTKTSAARLTVRFLSGTGQALATRTLGPVGRSGTAGHQAYARRQAAGALPAGARSALLVLTLATSLTNADGPNAPVAGYNRAVADGLRFSVSAPARRPVLAPPAAQVPRFQHVFLFYFENEDFNQVIGNTAQAPYLNSLVPHSSLLANFYAEEHPSDANYLALAGGSAFGIPLTDPAEENPLYTINARNIGDLVTTAHESWRGYLQSANGPCDDTVHVNYWDDDEPMMYFADVRERPAYCAEHLVPLPSLANDLRHASTTPNFAWIAPDDCSDMEGCGIKAGDDFLSQELGQIMRSPAWTRQRSLAIITFDEDNFDHEHPAQKVATLVLGSRGVRQGYVSTARYTHYSLLKTIEGALGLGTLTNNDRYAAATTDVFTQHGGPWAGDSAGAAPGPAAAPALAAGAQPAPVQTSATGEAAAGASPSAKPLADPTAFVVNYGLGTPTPSTVTPVNLVTRKAGRAIRVGADPQAIAVTPNGRTAYVVNSGSGTVTPISTVTRTAGPAIAVGDNPQAIAITPDGRTAYVSNAGSDTVTPISTATNQAGPPIRTGAYPRALAITPDGRTLYVLNWEGGSVTPVSTATNRPGRPIRTGSFPAAIAINRSGRTAYVANYGSDTVTPIAVGARRAGRPIPVGQAPGSLAVTPDGRTVYVVNGDTDTVTPITTATGQPGRPIRVGYSPASVAISRSGGTAYVVNTISGTVTPVSTSTGRAGHAISVGLYDYPLSVDLGLPGGDALVLDTYAGQVTPVRAATGRVFPAITVGDFPVADVIVP
ncbi:MAG TPA: alkaline phosphatase family protein [Streptosporangiaceae bacterium]